MAATDAAVGVVIDAILSVGGCMLLTADHGNVEEMAFPDGGTNTQHSTNPVPVAFVSSDPSRWTIRDGELSDVAPTLLGLLGIAVPSRMTGRSLLTRR
jgi:2,3-bisphosphoglycerate-independent phosphoglycerate mutase